MKNHQKITHRKDYRFILALAMMFTITLFMCNLASAGWYCDNINIFCDKNNMNHLGNNPESINTEKINWGILKKSINESCFSYEYIAKDTTYQNGELCFQTSLPSDFYYTQLEDGAVKFGWQILTAGVPPGQLKKPITITSNKDLSKLESLSIDWGDFDSAGLKYSISGNKVTIENADLTGYWLDPTIVSNNTGSSALDYETQRKTVQTSTGKIYVLYYVNADSTNRLLMSNDNGISFSEVNNFAAMGYSSMIIDENNTIHIVFESVGTSSDIYYAQWNTTSDTQIGSSLVIESGGSANEAERPDLALSDNGLLRVVYMKEDGVTNHWGIDEEWCDLTTDCLLLGNWNDNSIEGYAGMGNYAQYNPDITTNGTEFFLVWQGQNASYSSTYQAFYRYTLGGVWQDREVINGNATDEKIVPNIIVKDNIPMVVSFSDEGTYKIEFSKRESGTWSNDSNIYLNNTYPQDYPSLSTDGANLHVVWDGLTNAVDGECLAYSNSIDEGNTWTSASCIVGTKSPYGILTPGLSYQYPYSNNGDWYVDAVYLNYTGSQYDLLFERIANPYSEPITLNSPLNNTGYFINRNITFSCTAYSSSYNIKNLTFFLDGVANETSNQTYASCYQERTNASVSGDGSCSLNYTGNYSSTTGGIWNNPANTTDNNWSTYGGAASDTPELNITYIKPPLAVGANWQVKDHYGTRNITIPSYCWNADANRIFLRARSYFTNLAVGWGCWNGTAFVALVYNSGSGKTVYEEGIYWNVTTDLDSPYTLEKNISFSTVGNHNWTCEGYDTNNTSLNGSTYDFYTTDTIIVNSVTYDNPVTALSSQDFALNVTWDTTNFPNMNAELYYNETAYPSIVTPESAETAIITNTLSIPFVVSATNLTFYWKLVISDGAPTTIYTDDYNQTVNPSQVVACGGISNTTLVTFTTKEEATFNLLNASIEINLNYGGSNTSQNEEYNFSDYTENNSNWSICIYPSTGFTYMSGIVSYYKSINASYDRRDYWLNNALFTNETNNITLYLASTASTDIFTFTVKDESDSPVIGAYIYVERWDIGGNNFYTVSILKTDSDGKAFMNLRLNDAWYRYKVVTDGVLRLTEGPYKESTTSRTLRINTGSQVINGQIYEPLSTINGITHSLSFNNVTNTFTFSYTDVSGSTSTGCIWIDQILMAAPDRIYTSCINSASGTLSYPVVGNGTFAAYGVLTLDANYSNYQSIVDTLQVTIGGLERFAIVGNYGRVITLIAVGTAAMIGVASGSIFLGLLLVIATIFGADLIGLINVTSPSNVIFTLIAILIMIIITAARRRNG